MGIKSTDELRPRDEEQVPTLRMEPVSPFKTNDLASFSSLHLMRKRTAEAQFPAVQGIVLNEWKQGGLR